MKEYISMWKNWNNFKARTDFGGFWMAVFTNFPFGLAYAGLLMWLAVITGFYHLYLLAFIQFVPYPALFVRRLRDVGKRPYVLLFALIPLLGVILVFLYLIKDSVPDDGTPMV